MSNYSTPAEIHAAWESGELDAIEAHVLLKQLEDSIASISEAVRPFVRQAFERHHEGAKSKTIIHGYIVEPAETGVKWDYSSCGCSRLAALEKNLEYAKAALANRQKYLQGLAAPERDIDPETGEPTEDEHGMPVFVTKAVKTSTSFVKISKPKK